MAFFLAGAAAAWETDGFPISKRRTALVAGFLAALIMLPFHQFGAAMLASGLAAGLGMKQLPATQAFWPRIALSAAVGAALVPLAWGQWNQRELLPRAPAHRQVRAALDTAALEGFHPFLLNIPDVDFEFVARTRYGLMNDFTLVTSSVQYMPAIAGGLARMQEELYADWKDHWPRWTRREWKAKANRFGFTHVWSPIEIPALPAVVTTDTHTLYRAVE
jgi:hypothetical protein